MKLCALILVGCLLDSFAVLAQPQTHFLDMCADATNHTLFADSACYIDSNFDPNNFMNDPGRAHYSSPTCDKTKTLSAVSKQNLMDAHKAAPSYVQKKLCQLTLHDCSPGPGGTCYQLFVTPSPATSTTWTSWGFWEASDLCNAGQCTTPPDRKQAIGLGVFIAISENVLNGTTGSIVDLENKLVLALTRVPSGATSSRVQPLQFFRQPATMPKYAVLDVLAHELGHVLLADTNADAFFNGHPRSKVASANNNKCFDTKILHDSWNRQDYMKLNRATRWTTFLLNKGDSLINNHIAWRDVYKDVKNKAYSDAAVKIAALYNAKEFVSLWAALRPEEDFVETFKYKVLSDAMPSLTVNFGTNDINVLDYINASTPADKLVCLQTLGLFN